ncbi:MAG TPA: GNAT family N-acetyltransferase, partial [Candidatus Tectomicrobia bacterium]
MSEAFVTLAQRPDLAAQVRALGLEVWPEFLRHDAVCNHYWRLLYSTFARFQVVLCDPADTVIAAGHTIPLVWDGTQADLPSGIDGVLKRGVRGAAHSRAPTTLSALAAMVAPGH